MICVNTCDTMSLDKTKHILEYLVFRLFTGVVHISPPRIRRLEARWLEAIFRRFSRRHHRLVTHNLELAFPLQSPEERQQLQSRIYRHYTSLLVLLARLMAVSKPDRLVTDLEILNPDHLRNALDRGLGAVVFSAHMGNWEFLPLGIHRVIHAPVVTIARPLDNRFIDRRMRNFRRIMGSRLIDKHGAMRSMLKALDQGETILMLTDQNTVAREGVPVEFFGHPVSAVTSAAQLHLRRGTPLVPAFLRVIEGQPVLEFRPEIQYTPTRDRNTDIRNLTQICTCEIESAIRQSPEQWFWFHNRWKNHAKGDNHETK